MSALKIQNLNSDQSNIVKLQPKETTSIYGGALVIPGVGYTIPLDFKPEDCTCREEILTLKNL